MSTLKAMEYLKGAIEDRRVLEEIYKTMIRGALNSGEAEDAEDKLDEWFAERFSPNSVVLDKDDYSKALIRSLWIAPNLASLDFSGGRLRDFAQLWTDTARGFLGEIAVQKFLKDNFGLNVHLETRRGRAEEFMASDILVFEKGKSEPRKSRIRASIKTSKFNGRWLEIPESQFRQSDVFIFVKLGISRYHFSAYLKTLRIMEQLFSKGVELKELNESQVQTLSNEIPEWMPIPAYVSGFVDKENLNMPIHDFIFRTPRRRKAELGVRPISRVEITGGVGLFDYPAIEKLPEIKALNLGRSVPFVIAGIGKEVDGNFYASSGLLDFERKKWSGLVKKI